MNPGSEDFKSLRRLLALKRYEQPPPGYFNRFSGEVIGRIRAGETGEPASLMERLLGGLPWLQRLGQTLEAKPIFAGAFGAAVCALLVSGVVYSEGAGPMPAAPGMAAVDMQPTLVTANPGTMGQPLERTVLATSSTNPIAPSLDYLFEQVQSKIQPQAASFFVPAGN